MSAIHIWAADTLSRYWNDDSQLVQELDMHRIRQPLSDCQKLVMMKLPEWGLSAGVNGTLLVPVHTIEDNLSDWRKVDWLAAAAWYLNCTSERHYEQRHGPVHSYSHRLKSVDPRIWQRAWVNRIGLFLRLWLREVLEPTRQAELGTLPNGKIWLTHDVDAVTKTIPIRFKQTLFGAYNSLKLLAQGQIFSALDDFFQTLKFFFSVYTYWCFDHIIELESAYNQKSIFNFHVSGQTKKSFRSWLLNPSYDVFNIKLEQQIRTLLQQNWKVGLHPGFDDWADGGKLKLLKEDLEKTGDAQIDSIRQHWLRFSFEKTWKAQQEASFSLDSTLGFNDRSGFRAGAALTFNPWDVQKNVPFKIKEIPMVLMDSHLFDYQRYDAQGRFEEIEYWCREILSTHGEAAVIWHQRVFSKDYGWGGAYEHLLKFINNWTILQ